MEGGGFTQFEDRALGATDIKVVAIVALQPREFLECPVCLNFVDFPKRQVPYILEVRHLIEEREVRGLRMEAEGLEVREGRGYFREREIVAIQNLEVFKGRRNFFEIPGDVHELPEIGEIVQINFFVIRKEEGGQARPVLEDFDHFWRKLFMNVKFSEI